MAHWLGLEGRSVLVCGVANRRSVAWHVGQRLQEAGARVVWTVRTEERRAELAGRLQGEILVCDVSEEGAAARLAAEPALAGRPLAGMLHAIARADYPDGPRPFHETGRADFLRATAVSCFSLVELARALEQRFEPGASVVTVSISTTRMAAENYGYMAPVKAALDSTVVFLAKSLAARGVRFNAVCAGPLKTSSSAGIPGYLESYLYAERATLRKRALETAEVADAALFLLSPRSSGVNARGLVVDAGMDVNWFDRELVERAMRPEGA